MMMVVVRRRRRRTMMRTMMIVLLPERPWSSVTIKYKLCDVQIYTQQDCHVTKISALSEGYLKQSKLQAGKLSIVIIVPADS